MGIRKKDIVTVTDGDADARELRVHIEELPDSEYGYLLFDKKRNLSLPQLKYLFGVVLRTISKSLPDHPPTEALYSFFEEMFSPKLRCEINRLSFDYFNLKSLR